MRRSIETAPKDGRVVILEDGASGAFDVGQWLPEADGWVGKDGEPIKITPAYWSPLARDKYLSQQSDISSVGPASRHSRRRFAAYSIAAALLLAALVGTFFRAEVTAFGMRYAGLQDILGSSRKQVVEQNARVPNQDSPKTNSSARQQQAETGAAHARATEQKAAKEKQAGDVSVPRQSLEKEQRTEVLANELAQARRAINRLNQQLRSGAANFAQLLGQEREKTAAVLQEATAMRQELEQERARGAALASELAIARRETVTKVALLNKARDDTVQLNQAPENTTAEELGQERERRGAPTPNSVELPGQEPEKAAALVQEVTAARQDLEAERARGAALASELATARREADTNVALLNRALDEAAQLKQASEKTTEEMLQERDSLGAKAASSAALLGQERENAAALAQEVSTARQELEEERARRTALASELAMTRLENETNVARLNEARTDAAQLRQASEKTIAELRQKRENAVALVREASDTQQDIEPERARGAVPASELAMARRETETNVALPNKALDGAARLEQIAEKTEEDLSQERGIAEAMRRELNMAWESALRVMEVRPPLEGTMSQPPQGTQAVGSAAPERPAAVGPQGGPEVARLMARARTLLDHGNIGAARIVLERAAEMGSAQASFMLAETYDPAILSRWRTFGTRGEASKARELYAKAHAGGIQEAKNRSDALDQ